jgi:hypothetical protein
MSKTTTSTFARVDSRDDNGRLRVMVRFSGCPTCDGDVDTYLSDLNDVYEQEKKFVLLYDARNIGNITPKVMWRQASFMRKKDSHTKRLVTKCAIVLSSPLARKLLDTLFVIKPPACPLEVFDCIDEAKKYLKSANV